MRMGPPFVPPPRNGTGRGGKCRLGKGSSRISPRQMGKQQMFDQPAEIHIPPVDIFQHHPLSTIPGIKADQAMNPVFPLIWIRH